MSKDGKSDRHIGESDHARLGTVRYSVMSEAEWNGPEVLVVQCHVRMLLVV